MRAPEPVYFSAPNGANFKPMQVQCSPRLLWPNKFSRQKGACPDKTLIVSCCATDCWRVCAWWQTEKNTFIKMQRRQRKGVSRLKWRIKLRSWRARDIFHSKCQWNSHSLDLSCQVAVKGIRIIPAIPYENWQRWLLSPSAEIKKKDQQLKISLAAGCGRESPKSAVFFWVAHLLSLLVLAAFYFRHKPMTIAILSELKKYIFCHRFLVSCGAWVSPKWWTVYPRIRRCQISPANRPKLRQQKCGRRRPAAPLLTCGPAPRGVRRASIWSPAAPADCGLCSNFSTWGSHHAAWRHRSNNETICELPASKSWARTHTHSRSTPTPAQNSLLGWLVAFAFASQQRRLASDFGTCSAALLCFSAI